MADASDTVRIADKTTVTQQLAVDSNGAASVKAAANSGVDIGDVDVLTIAAGDNNIGNVDIVTVPTDPFGANADAASSTGSISSKLRQMAAAVSGTEFQIDVVGALPAGSAVIGSVGIDNTTIDDYESVAASSTGTLGPTGAANDLLTGVLVIPANTSPGSVTVVDGGTSTLIFTGGASSVSNLVPFFVPFPAKSSTGAWKILNGANVSSVGFGKFT